MSLSDKKYTSLPGFEPGTFRLTAERASRLRHRDVILCNGKKIEIIVNKIEQTIIGLHLRSQLISMI